MRDCSVLHDFIQHNFQKKKTISFNMTISGTTLRGLREAQYEEGRLTFRMKKKGAGPA